MTSQECAAQQDRSQECPPRDKGLDPRSAHQDQWNIALDDSENRSQECAGNKIWMGQVDAQIAVPRAMESTQDLAQDTTGKHKEARSRSQECLGKSKSAPDATPRQKQVGTRCHTRNNEDQPAKMQSTSRIEQFAQREAAASLRCPSQWMSRGPTNGVEWEQSHDDDCKRRLSAGATMPSKQLQRSMLKSWS